MVNLSVVIPIHNAEKYIVRCIESVLEQSYEDMEIILVDDGSTDTSAEICKKYCKLDKRIRYIYQEDSWLSASRNNGMRNAIGDYIIFLDPDDYWEPNLCKEVMPILEKTNLDLLQFDIFNETSPDEKTTISFCRETHIEEWTDSRLLENICTKWTHVGYAHTVWSKVFNRRWLLNTGITFVEELRAVEDLCFFGMLFPYINKIGYLHKPLYHYVQNPQALTHNKERIKTIFINMIQVNDFIINSWTEEIRKDVKEILPLLFCKRLRSAFYLAQRFYSSEKICRMLCEDVGDRVNSELTYENVNVALNLYAKICGLSWKDKVMYLMFAYSLIDGEQAMIEWQKMFLRLK